MQGRPQISSRFSQLAQLSHPGRAYTCPEQFFPCSSLVPTLYIPDKPRVF
jgi:hypothetical protein